MKRGKKYRKLTKNIDKSKIYSLEEAIKKVKELSYSKFVGTLELHMDLNIPKDKDAKSIKGSISLPYSTEVQDIKIAVFTDDKVEEAKKAGADLVGLDNLIKDVKEGKINFDIAIATPSAMSKMATIGKELGPKGLMPNPKTGTVTEDIESTIQEYRKGKQTFTCDSSGVIHMGVGKLDMEDEKLIENIHEAVKAIEAAVGKNYVQIINKLHLSPTMGSSVKVRYSRE
ncbi:MAG: 50S ribosomal protein L1 [Candidatus Dojkabacteria bacterium]